MIPVSPTVDYPLVLAIVVAVVLTAAFTWWFARMAKADAIHQTAEDAAVNMTHALLLAPVFALLVVNVASLAFFFILAPAETFPNTPWF